MNNLITLNTTDKDSIVKIIDNAFKYHEDMVNVNKDFTNKYSNKVIVSLFFEPSTRTSFSFSIAAKRLGVQILEPNMKTSSSVKGEDDIDTMMVVDAMRPDAIIVRHPDNEFAKKAAASVSTPIINAGSGSASHPTQGLIDAMTIKQAKGTLSGLNVAICGDIKHSRVASSTIAILNKFNNNIRLVSPESLNNKAYETKYDNVQCFDSVEKGFRDADVVICLRMQKERFDSNLSDKEINAYINQFKISHDNITYAKNDVIVMHPGPMNREVEISGALADDLSKSCILKQVSNSIALRMSVIDYALSK